ncbi:hypothetical protein [Rhodovulum euryhalinum]|uniref:hypothetical protein n=1 Tax=Rhodovulum euryhalinum TaxID=35805 RepID=UPI001044EAC2|nr:hypothetical protein [Rhodovulum euryhalinum]
MTGHFGRRLAAAPVAARDAPAGEGRAETAPFGLSTGSLGAGIASGVSQGKSGAPRADQQEFAHEGALYPQNRKKCFED